MAGIQSVNLVVVTRSAELFDQVVLALSGNVGVRLAAIVANPIAAPQACLDAGAAVALVDDDPPNLDAVAALRLLASIPELRVIALGSPARPARWRELVDAGATRVLDRWRDIVALGEIVRGLP